MFLCISCLSKAGQESSKNLVLTSCSQCGAFGVECSAEALESQFFNNEVSNWHKYSEGKSSISSSPSSKDSEIPENGLYLWLRPITPTSSKDQQEG